LSESLHIRRYLAIGLPLLFLVSGCGFQLRGTSSVPPDMQRTYIQATDRHSLFYQRLRTELTGAGVELVDSPVDATAIFAILSDITDQRVLSVSARNVPREYEVYYTIRYSVSSGQKTMIEPRTQTETRAYTWDETQVLGKAHEEQVLREALVDDLVRIILIQISAI